MTAPRHHQKTKKRVAAQFRKLPHLPKTVGIIFPFIGPWNHPAHRKTNCGHISGAPTPPLHSHNRRTVLLQHCGVAWIRQYLRQSVQQGCHPEGRNIRCLNSQRLTSFSGLSSLFIILQFQNTPCLNYSFSPHCTLFWKVLAHTYLSYHLVGFPGGQETEKHCENK